MTSRPTAKFRWTSAWAILVFCSFICYTIVYGQDLQFECITCADKFDKCEIDCAWSKQSIGKKAVIKCQDECLEKRSRCKDTTEAVDCLTCTTNCASVYDHEMRLCLAEITRSRVFNKAYSPCELSASNAMDLCMAKCSINNNQGGWPIPNDDQ